MGDHEYGFMSLYFLYGFHKGFFRGIIQGVRRFIENQNFRIPIQGTGNAYPLPLSAAQSDAPFSDDRIVAVLEFLQDKIVDVSDSASVDHLIHIDAFLLDAERDVRFDGRIAQEYRLGNIADYFSPAMYIRTIQFDRIDGYRTIVHFMQSHEYVYECRLS
jgi:hypothetical protein